MENNSGKHPDSDQPEIEPHNTEIDSNLLDMAIIGSESLDDTHGVSVSDLSFDALQAGLKPAIDFRSMRAAAMPLGLDFKALQATVVSSGLDFKAMRAAVVSPGLDFKAMRAAVVSSGLDFKAMRAAVVSPGLDFKAMRAAVVSPGLDFKAMRAAVVSPGLDFKAMRAAVVSSGLDFKAMRAAVVSSGLDFKAMRAAVVSPELDFKAMRAAVMSPVLDLKAIQTMVSSLPAMVSLGTSLAVISSLPSSQQFDWHTLSAHAFFESLNTVALGGSSELPPLVSKLAGSVGSGVTAEDIAAIQAAIEAELSEGDSSGDASTFSTATKWFITWLIWLASASFGYLAMQNGAREELCFLQPKILPGMTSGQLGKAIRSAACEVPLSVLKNYRFVRGDSVHLRAGPGMKAEILQVYVADGALLEVIENDNRVWLYVSVVGQEGVQGWISRKYVRRFVD